MARVGLAGRRHPVIGSAPVERLDPRLERPSAARPLARGASTVTWGVLAASTLWRATSLGRSLWWDEIYTAWAYVLRGPDTIRLADSYIANNHVLFSWLSWASVGLLGTSEPVLRLWAFLPGTLASVWLLSWVGRRLGWPVAAILSILLALSPLHAMLVTEARGYGLVLLSSVGLLVGGVRAVESHRIRDDVMVAGSALLGALTVPSFVVPLVIAAVLVLLRRPRHRLRLLAFGVPVGATITWWYLPLLAPITRSVSGVGARHGDPATLIAAVHAPAQLLAGPSFAGLTDLLPGSLATAALAGALLWGGLLLLRDDHILGVFVTATPPAAVLLLAAVGFHLIPRYIAYLLPLVLLGVSVSLAAFGRLLLRRMTRLGPWLLVLATVVVGATTLPVVRAEHTPRQQFQAVLHLADHLEPTRVLYATTDVGYLFYLREHPAEVIEEPGVLNATLCAAREGTMYVEPATAKAPPLPCLTYRGFEPHRFEQRAAPGALTAWVLP